MTHLAARFAAHLTARLAARLAASPGPLRDPDRGDVPGWVLVTVMTAGIVVVLSGLALDTFQAMFTNAMSQVSAP